jgi:hypothetical protein
VLVHVAARLPATTHADLAVVSLRLDGPLPVAATARVPVTPGAVDASVECAATFDLRAAAGDEFVAGTHLVYVLAGSRAAGPYFVVVE